VKALLITATIALAVVIAGACSSADDSAATTTRPSSTTSVTPTTSTLTTSTSTSTTTSSTTTTRAPATTVADPPPGQVTGVTARTGGGSGEVVLTWTQNPEPDVVSYTISRAATAGGASTQIGSMTRAQVNAFPVAPYVDVPVRVGYYRVRAVDAAGNQGPPSTEVCGASPGNSC
jgi:hypothetical protein